MAIKKGDADLKKKTRLKYEYRELRGIRLENIQTLRELSGKIDSHSRRISIQFQGRRVVFLCDL